MLEQSRETLILIESNIDDMSGEALGALMQRLFEAGAVDVWYTPIYMKKNRPAVLFSALVKAEDESEIVRNIFMHSSTAGLRKRIVERLVMERSFVFVDYMGDTIRVKKLVWEDIEKYEPEWEDCAAVAKKHGKQCADIYAFARANAYGK